MSNNNHRIAGLARVAALSLVLVAPLGGTAFAQSWGAGQDTSFGADHADQALAAARAPALKAANDNDRALAAEFKLGQNNDFGSAVAPQPGRANIQPVYGRLATTGTPAAVQKNLVGAGGPIDDVYRGIYQPGSIPADNG